MTVQTLLVFWRPLEFSPVTLETFCNRGAICPTLHILMTRRSMAFYTIQAFLVVKAVIEYYDLFFDCITQIKHIFMAVQTSPGGQFIISEVFRRHELVPRVLYKVPSLGDNSSPMGMALKTGCLIGWVSVRVLPQFSNLRMALSTDTLIGSRVAYEIGTYSSPADQDNEY
jgi:hypothetical protein